MSSRRKKIALIGSGNIGGTLAFLVGLRALGDVVLYDLYPDKPAGKALDIWQAGPIAGFTASMRGGNAPELLQDADVVVVTAGIARKPGMSRDALLEVNGKVMQNVGLLIRRYCPQAFVVCVTNPLDAMVWVLQRACGLPGKRIVGMAGVLDSARFSAFLAEACNVSAQDVQAFVLGGHGDTMVPMIRHASVAGIRVSELIDMKWISQQQLDHIVTRTRKGGGEVVGLLKDSSAYYAPAVSVIAMIEAYLYDQKRVLPCAAFLQGEYGVRDVYVGVPVVLGGNGVERIVELSLNDEEQRMFANSIESVLSLVGRCKELLE